MVARSCSKPPSPSVPEASSISLRPETEADTAFLLAVYTGTRLEELAATGWSGTQRDEFCRMQFEAQDSHYRTHYPSAERSIVLLDGAPAGRLYVDRWAREIRIMDIALLPDLRGRGAGTRLLSDLKDEARYAGKILSIHVERCNPALSLYARLGFRLAEDKGIYLLLHWDPALT